MSLGTSPAVLRFSVFQFFVCDLRLSHLRLLLCAVVAFASRAFRNSFFRVFAIRFSPFYVSVARDEPGSSQVLFANLSSRFFFVSVARDEPGSFQV